MVLGPDHLYCGLIYNNLGVAMNKKRGHDKAFDYYQKCLDLRLKTLGSDHPSVAGTYNNIGITLIDKGRI